MVSRTKWIVRGKALRIKHKKRGFWLTVDCDLSNECSAQHTTIDCWLPCSMNDKRRNFYKRFVAVGVLIFEKKDTYFLTEALQ